MTDATAKKLGIKDRLIIPTILPEEGGLVAQRICKDIRKKVGLSQDEMKSVNMRDVRNKEGGSSVVWDTQKKDGTPIPEPTITVVFTGAELSLIAEQIGKLDKAGKVNQENLETCEKFLDPQSEPDANTPEETA